MRTAGASEGQTGMQVGKSESGQATVPQGSVSGREGGVLGSNIWGSGNDRRGGSDLSQT